jgi:FixJ family two-component response regulator
MFPRLICIVDGAMDYRLAFEHVFLRYLSYYSVRFFSTEKAFLDELPFMQPLPGLVLVDHDLAQLGGDQIRQALSRDTRYQTMPVVRMSEHTAATDYPDQSTAWLVKELDLAVLRDSLAQLCFEQLEIR